MMGNPADFQIKLTLLKRQLSKIANRDPKVACQDL